MMGKYARLKNGAFNGVVRDFASHPGDPGAPWEWLPYVLVDPPFDSATQNRSGPVVEIGDEVTETYTVSAKNNDELDDVASDVLATTPLAEAMVELLWELREVSTLDSISKDDYKQHVRNVYTRAL